MRKKRKKPQKVVLYRAILHTEGYTISTETAETWQFTEEDIKTIMDYMKAWDGVHVTVTALVAGEYSMVGWPPEEEEKIKEAIYLMEQDPAFGSYINDRERFETEWAAGEWEPSGSIIFSPEMVEILGELGGPSGEQ